MKKIIAPFMLVTLAVALSACDSGPPTPINPSTTKINGRVVSGSGTGNATLRGKVDVLATAPIDASGNFTLTLPDANKLSADLVAASNVLGNIGCSGTLNSSASDAQGYGLTSLDLNRTKVGRMIAGQVGRNVFNLPTSFNGRGWIYVDKDTTLSGSVDCKALVGVDISIPATVNIKAKAGWNIVQVSGSVSMSGISGTVHEVADGSTVWRTIDEL